MNNSVVLLEQTTNSFKKISQRQLRFVVWELIPFGTLSWQWSNAIKLMTQKGRLNLTVSALKQLVSKLAVLVAESLRLSRQGWPN